MITRCSIRFDSSPRGDRSKSRKLAKEFIAVWQDQHPDDVITYRDLRQAPVPHVTEDWIVACFTPPEALTPEMAEPLRFSDELVAMRSPLLEPTVQNTQFWSEDGNHLELTRKRSPVRVMCFFPALRMRKASVRG